MAKDKEIKERDKKLEEKDKKLEEQVKLNAKKEKEIEKLLLKIKQMEIQQKELSEVKLELPPTMRLPPSTKNMALKAKFNNNFGPFVNEGFNYPESGRIHNHLDEIEPSEYESALYVSERIVN